MDWRRRLTGPRGRRARIAGLALLTVVATSASGFLVLPLATRTLVGALQLLTKACVWIAMSLSTGVSVWSLLVTVGRVTGRALFTPRASAALVVLVLVAIVALIGLQRLLGSEEESSP